LGVTKRVDAEVNMSLGAAESGRRAEPMCGWIVDQFLTDGQRVVFCTPVIMQSVHLDHTACAGPRLDRAPSSS